MQFKTKKRLFLSVGLITTTAIMPFVVISCGNSNDKKDVNEILGKNSKASRFVGKGLNTLKYYEEKIKRVDREKKEWDANVNRKGGGILNNAIDFIQTIEAFINAYKMHMVYSEGSAKWADESKTVLQKVADDIPGFVEWIKKTYVKYSFSRSDLIESFLGYIRKEMHKPGTNGKINLSPEKIDKIIHRYFRDERETLVNKLNEIKFRLKRIEQIKKMNLNK